MKKVLSLCLAVMTAATVQAQLVDPEPYIANAKEDANYLAGGYLTPFGKSLTSSLSNGWYRSADLLKPGSFSISIAPTLLRIPDEEDQFTIRNSEMKELELVNGEQALSPTAFGSSDEGPALRSKTANSLGQRYTFNAPSGADSDYMLGAGINAAVGLPLNTTVHGRFLPNLTLQFEEQELKLLSWGLGARHSLSQYFGEEPFIDVAVFGAYSHLKMEMPLETGDDHEVVIESDGYTLRGIVSKTFFEVLTPYFGFGVSGGSSSININGTYEYSSGAAGLFGSNSVQDPVQVATENQGVLATQAGLSAEFFNLIFLDVNYTFTDYNALTAAIGLQFEI